MFYLDGFLYESTGQVGESTIRKVRIEDGAVLQSRTLLPSLFGEGIVNWNDEIVSLTWQNQIGFRWNLKDFSQIRQFSYAGEGWALTQDGQNLYKSDGTSILRFLDPLTLAGNTAAEITVTAEGQPVKNHLNGAGVGQGRDFGQHLADQPHQARIDPGDGQGQGLDRCRAAARGAAPDRPRTDPQRHRL